MPLRNEILIFSVLGFRSDKRIELQAPVIEDEVIFTGAVYVLLQ